MTSTNVRGQWTQETPIYIGGRTDMLSPIGSTSDTTPTFTWRPVDGAARYDLWVDRLGGASQVIREQNLTSPSFTSSTLPAGNYRSWVRAVSTTGEFALWSVFVDFTIVENSGSGNALLVNLAIDEHFADSVGNSIEVVEFEIAALVERRNLERDDAQMLSTMISPDMSGPGEISRRAPSPGLSATFSPSDEEKGLGESLRVIDEANVTKMHVDQIARKFLSRS